MKRYSSNDYANLCYNIIGKVGYVVFIIATLMDIYGAHIGMIVVMTDFLCGLPFLNNSIACRVTVQAVLTVVATILCVLRDVRYSSPIPFTLASLCSFPPLAGSC